MAKQFSITVDRYEKPIEIAFNAYKAKIAKAALKAIADNPGISWDSVCEIIGRRKMTADDILGDLVFTGLITPPPQFKNLWAAPDNYFITEQGRAILAD